MGCTEIVIIKGVAAPFANLDKMNQKGLIAILFLCVFAFYSCERDELTEEIPTQTFEQPSDGKTVLGKKLENPYSVENMKKALAELKASNKLKSGTVDEIDINTTHLYIRFIPKNEDELSLLKSDSTLNLYSYPLDYEIKEGGGWYHDPDVPLDQPTYQYAAVEASKELTNEVEYEILEELFIPYEDKDDDTQLKSVNLDYFDLATLEDKALEITNNLNEEDSLSKSLKRSKWRPSGRIMTWDDNFNNSIGVEGVKVRARRWFTTHTGYADSDGYFSCNGRFRRSANYSINWERHDFEIRYTWLYKAEYRGPKQRGAWNITFKGAHQEYYATIFRAAYHYYYKDIEGLRRPPKNSTWKTQLKIRAHYKENEDANGNHAEWRRFLGLGNAIKIYNPQHKSRDIYATTIHELAHASHWNMSHSTFNDTETIVKESWARGVQWELTRMVYPNYKGGSTYLPWYTQIVVDMLDSRKDDYSNYGKSYYNGDRVEGYTIKQLEDALQGQKNLEGWKNNIKTKYNNGTESKLDTLFEKWN